MNMNTECVLVVEDEGLIRMNLVAELEDAGLKVLEARTADEALIVLDENSDVGTIFTDIDMPGSMNGLDLAKKVRQSHPQMSIIVTSGFLKMSKDELPPEVRYIGKLYDIADVVRQIRELASLKIA
ncbi:response regulator [Rhizobium lusitanum]|uniref:Response regulator n=1 Tax=Rhizobium lusitanum TaxID=293958 RepID=A0A6L9UCM8_9HYPH|nr:response regulator [Rhizobium lusitanum]NEI73111.1 response regulator [Rhizobium lusitanum]